MLYIICRCFCDSFTRENINLKNESWNWTFQFLQDFMIRVFSEKRVNYGITRAAYMSIRFYVIQWMFG